MHQNDVLVIFDKSKLVLTVYDNRLNSFLPILPTRNFIDSEEQTTTTLYAVYSMKLKEVILLIDTYPHRMMNFYDMSNAIELPILIRIRKKSGEYIPVRLQGIQRRTKDKFMHALPFIKRLDIDVYWFEDMTKEFQGTSSA